VREQGRPEQERERGDRERRRHKRAERPPVKDRKARNLDISLKVNAVILPIFTLAACSLAQCGHLTDKKETPMLKKTPCLLPLLLLVQSLGCCCHHAEVTCYSLSNPCEPDGIPFYLPKPLLIISKNFRYIADTGEGKSMGAAPIPADKFDNQAQYADLKANVSTAPPTGGGAAKPDASGAKQQTGSATTPDTAVTNNPGVIPPGTFKDGVTPDTFYTYQVVFVPDLSQKYAIKVKGGPGEFRAAMNLVNGWMFTGLGPFYLKDSSTAQNIMACGAAITLGGRGVADVVTSVADLSKFGAKPQTGAFASGEMAARITEIKLLMDRNGLRLEPLNLPSYAEIHVYEPHLVDGEMQWRPVVHNVFDRTILGVVSKTVVPPPVAKSKNGGGQVPGQSQPPGGTPAPDKDGSKPDEGKPPAKGTGGDEQAGEFGSPTALETAITNAVGNQVIQALPQVRAQAQAQAATLGTPAAGGGNNVTVNVNPPRSLFGQWLPCCCKPKPRIRQVMVAGAEESVEQSGATVTLSGATQQGTEFQLHPVSNTDQ
jgi:hypothetical protein